MKIETTYEISSYRNGRWEVLGFADDKTSAKTTAYQFLASNHHNNIRVIEEIFDPITEEFTTKIIFTGKPTQKTNDATSPMGKEFWSGKNTSKTKQDIEVASVTSEEASGQAIGEEFINRLMILLLISGGIILALGGLIYFYLDVLKFT